MYTTRMRFSHAFLCLAVLAASAPASGDTFIVDTTADTNNGVCLLDCSLREAIQLANQNPGPDVVVVPAGDPYVLTIPGRLEDLAQTGDLDIYGELTVVGAGAATTIVDGGALDRVFDVRNGAAVTFTGLTIRNGDTGTSQGENFGGGIYAENAVSLTVRNSVITGCRVQTSGGGIFANASPVTVTDTVLSANQASSGGGIQIGHAPGALTRVTIEGNEASLMGGGLDIVDSDTDIFNEVTVSHSTIRLNTAGSQGGGIHAQGDHLVVANTVITDNDGGNDGGGVYVSFDSQVEILGSTIAGNQTRMDLEFAGDGGGIAVAGMLLLEDSTVSGNTANNKGGGVSLQANHATIRNSTISGNTAVGFSGGGLDVGNATLELIYTTVVENAAGDRGDNLRTAANTPRVELQSSILADPTGGNSNCLYTSGAVPTEVVTLGGNVDDDDSCRLAAPDDRPGGDPALEPLADNGGPTLTHMPLAGSDAIDFGTGAACPPSDQRGYGRGVDGDGDEQPACDSGAVEFLPEPGGIAGVALAALAALARGRNRIQRDR
jgi:CSLREA domain-containing protein